MKLFGKQFPSIVIFDPTTPEEMQEEPSWRPNDPNILQVEMVDLDEWAFYRAPDSVREFASFEALRNAVKTIIRKHMLDTSFGRLSVEDIRYESEAMTDRFLSVVTNYRIANLDLENGTVDNLLDDDEVCRYRGMQGAIR